MYLLDVLMLSWLVTRPGKELFVAMPRYLFIEQLHRDPPGRLQGVI